MHRSYNAIKFPILYHKGEYGWSVELNGDNGVTPWSRMQYYAYRFMKRDDDFEMLHRSGRLMQEYMVDEYCKVEDSQIQYLSFNQTKIRGQLFQWVLDQLLHDSNVGSSKSFVLPSPFIMGPRFMQKLFQYSMCIVRKYGKSYLFITFTCNPDWK